MGRVGDFRCSISMLSVKVHSYPGIGWPHVVGSSCCGGDPVVLGLQVLDT